MITEATKELSEGDLFTTAEGLSPKRLVCN